jgi:hypothetical protein
MRNTHEKIQKIDKSVSHGNISFWAFVFIILAIIAINAPLSGLLVILCLFVLSYSFDVGGNWHYESRWKKLFAKEFPDINEKAIEQTVAVLSKEAGYSYYFSDVAKAVVFSLQDEWDGDTLLRNTFDIKAKNIYRSFLPKET